MAAGVVTRRAYDRQPAIRIFIGNGAPEGDMLDWIADLREICETRDAGRLLLALKEIVPDYSPSTHLLKRVIEPRRHPAVAAAGAPWQNTRME